MRPLALSTMVPWACVAALVWVSVLPGCSRSESEPGPDAAPSPQAGDPRPARPPAPRAPVVSAELRSLLDATALSDADTFKDAMQRVAKLRAEAKASSAAVGKLTAGTKVTVLAQARSWRKIRGGRVEGWVRAIITLPPTSLPSVSIK